ncbi:MAG: hypothetical protein RL160_1028, partial [Bacteroidota bacterium]
DIFAGNNHQNQFMKKLLFSCVGLLFGAQLTYAAPSCGDGIATTKTWTNSTRDFKWETANNWSPSGVPDCDDNVVMGNAFDCDINSAVKINNLTCPQTFTKRISIKGTGSLRANDITLSGGSILGAVTNDTFVARNLTMGFGSLLITNHAIIRGTLSMGNSQFNPFSNANIDIMNLSLRNFARFNAPDGYSRNPQAFVSIRGDFYRESVGTFSHNNGLVRFSGNTQGTINTNNTEMNFHIIEVDKKADGAGDITTPAYLRVIKTLGAGKGSRIIALQRLSLIEASFNEWSNNNQIDMIGSRDSVVIHSSMANNISTNYIGVNGAPNIGFTGSGNGVFIINALVKGAHNVVIEKNNKTDRVTVLNKQEIGWPGYRTLITKGILAFDGSTSARINGGNQGLTVAANGQLIAPDDDTLYFNGSWNFANETSFDPQNGVVCLANNGSMNGFTHNSDTVYFNDLVVDMPNTANPSNGISANFASGSDVVGVRGNLTFPSTNKAYIGNAQFLLYGDMNISTAVNNTSGSLPNRIVFAGTGDQTITLSSNARAQFGGVIQFNKPSGKVIMGSHWDIKKPIFTKGIVKTGSYDLTITNAFEMITGTGSDSSYVDGPLTIDRTQGTNWRLYTFFPIGKGSTFAPARLESVSGADASFKIEYFPTGYTGDNTVNSPLDTVVASEYWKVTRVAGSNSIRAHIHNVNVPSNWTSTKQRVAYNHASSDGWIDGGRAASDVASFLRSGNSVNVSEVFVTGAIDKDATAPMMVAGEGISGTEVATQRTKSAQLDNNGKPLVQFEVYPNPVANTLNMEVINADKGVVTVSDMTGKIFGTYNAAEVKSINFSAFARGLYLVNFTDGLVNITHRISKN